MISIAVVGYGYWGPNLARNINAVPEARLKYICDLDPARRAKAERAYPEAMVVETLEQIVKDPDLDAVAIATPVHTHYRLAKFCLENGKHVLLEKPMAQSVEQCEELVNLARNNKLQLMVDHTFLYTPAIQWMKKYIEANEIGKTIYFDSERVNLGIIQSDSNVIWDLAPHDFSILSYLFAATKPVHVYAVGTKHFNARFEEIAHITVEFDNGSVAHIHNSWISPIKLRKIIVGGDKKMIVFDDVEPVEKIRVYDRGVNFDLSQETSFTPVYRSGDIVIPNIGTGEALYSEIVDFCRAVKEERSTLSDGAHGLEVVKLIVAAQESLRTKAKVAVA